MDEKVSRGRLFRMLRTQSAASILEERLDLDDEGLQFLEEMASLEQVLPLINRDLPPVPEFRLPYGFSLNEAPEEARIAPSSERGSGDRSFWPWGRFPKIVGWVPALVRAPRSVVEGFAFLALAMFAVVLLLPMKPGEHGNGGRRLRGDQGEPTLKSPLFQAAFQGNDSLVSALLKEGYSVHDTDERGRTALHWAAMENFPNIAAALLAGSADPNAVDDEGRTPLMTAAAHGNVDMVTWLLDRKAKTGLRDKNGNTALELANQFQYKACADLIRNHMRNTEVEEKYDHDAGNRKQD